MSEGPKTVNIEPNYEGMREWLKNVARTDLPNAIRINETLGCEGLRPTELVEIHKEANGNTCPSCGHVNYKRPVSFTHEGAAEFYCDDCESFYKDFDVLPEEEEDEDTECLGHSCDDYAGDHPHAAIGDVFYCDGSCQG